MKTLILALLLAGCANFAEPHLASAPADMDKPYWAGAALVEDMAAPIAPDMTWPGYPDTCNSGCTPPGGPGSGPGGHSLK